MSARSHATRRALLGSRFAAHAVLLAALLPALGGAAARADDGAPASPGGGPAPADPFEPAGQSAIDAAFARAVAAVGPSLVEVEALGGLPPEHRAPENEAGAQQGVLVGKGFKQAFGPSTGLVVDADGLILTSTFVLQREPRHLIVTLADGRSFVAKVVGRDDARALALLKIDAHALPVPRFAPQAKLAVGRYALALGRGLGGPTPAVSRGIVSALDRVGGIALQSSAAISPVNYGGPLVSLDGEVFGLLVPLSVTGGMASVDLYDSGIGFAIPSPDLVALVPRLAGGAALQAAFLGVVPDASHRGGGVRIEDVAEGSPAEAAGLRPGEVIVAVDGVPLAELWQLRRALARAHAGDELTLRVRWQTEERELKVTLAAPPPPEDELEQLPDVPDQGGGDER